MENSNLQMVINNEGDLFYLKWRKDTIRSLIIAPFFFGFFALIFTMIVGLSLKLLFILIWPLILTVLLFIYVPFFVRKKYINNMIKLILVKDNSISVETFKWFNFDSVKESILIDDIEIKESIDVSFFRGKKLYLLKIKNYEQKSFYMINDFFDNIDIVTSRFK
jgi:hypothetical protein